jgi:UDPglucose--hexose-1-phosphate uridylyltransferase
MATGGTPARHADGVFEMIDGIGIHEVIVETTSHDATLSDLDDKGFSDVMKTYRQRLMNCAKNHDVKYALIFRNSGLLAGASLEHPHSQLIALPAVPHMIADELETSLVHFKKKGTCLFCDMLEAERRGAARVIAESSGFIAISPYAPRFPFETWVFPRRHMSAFETLDDDAVDSFSKFFKGVLSKMGAVLSNAPYNFMLHTAPTGSGPLNHYHWHVEITPCLTTIAGFERGTNCFINPTSPEEAAKALRL